MQRGGDANENEGSETTGRRLKTNGQWTLGCLTSSRGISSSAVIVTQKMFGYCGGLRAVSLFVNRSAMFVEAVFKSTFGFVLFVRVVTLYHVDNVFGVAVNVMINKSSFARRTKCIISKSVVYVIAC